jgi:hypothetical protein
MFESNKLNKMYVIFKKYQVGGLVVTTLVLGSQPRQKFTKVWVESEP